MFLLVPAYPGCPGQTAVKWLLYTSVCTVLYSVSLAFLFVHRTMTRSVTVELFEASRRHGFQLSFLELTSLPLLDVRTFLGSYDVHLRCF